MKKILTTLLMSGSALSYAQVPSDFTLRMLEDSYIQSKTCKEQCGVFTGIKLKNLNLDTKDIVFELQASSSQLFTVELPFNYNSLIWSDFLLDGKPYNAVLVRNERIFIAVPKGNHVIELRSKLKPNQSKVEFSQDPKDFENNTTVNAIINKTGDNFFLEIEGGKKRETKEKEIEIDKVIYGQPLYKIERELFLSEKWKLKTTVTPIFANNKVSEINVPLIEGENILNNNFEVIDGFIKLSLSGNSVSWESVVQPKDKMIFKNTDINNLERWVIYNENNWLYSYKGINPISIGSNPQYKNIDTWVMWPNEQINVEFTLPARVDGKTSNVTDLNFFVDSSDNKKQWITFNIETSLGGRYNIKLEDKTIKLEDLYVNNAKLNNQLKEGNLALDLLAGKNEVKLLINQENDFLYSVPKIKFESAVTNASFSMDRNRWVLLVGGGDVHSAVLLWGYIVFFSILAFGLSKIKESPLKLSSWLLLLLGLCATSYWTSVIVVSWILAFAFRQKIIEKFTINGEVPTKIFNKIQTFLGFVSVVGLLTLLGVIAKGLLQNPELFLLNTGGYGTHSAGIQWYIQTWTGENKMPWMFSLPLNYYKIIILAWAVWLAFSLMSWLKWMWSEYSKGGYWKKEEKTLTEPNSVEAKEDDDEDLFETKEKK